jgi:hypothetical protein
LLAPEIEVMARRISDANADAETAERARRIAEESFMQDTVTGAGLRPIIDLTLGYNVVANGAGGFRPTKRSGNRPHRPPRGPQNADLVSFVLRQMHIGSHGNTPSGLEQPCQYQIGAGCCTSRQNSGAFSTGRKAAEQ